MNGILISGTGSGVGKTFVSLKLCELFNQNNIKAIVTKPIETGICEDTKDSDTLMHLKNAQKYHHKITIKDINLFSFSLPASPFVSAQNQNITIDTEQIKKHFFKLKNSFDLVMIEGAGGIMVPIKMDYFFIDLARELDLWVVIVNDGNLGGIHHTLSAMQILKYHDLKCFTIINAIDKQSFAKISKPFFDKANLDICFDINTLFEKIKLATILEKSQR